MHINFHHVISAVCSAILLVATPVAEAAESSSYQLYENIDTADSITLGSSSFTLNEAGETWTAYPIASTSFQIVTAPLVQAAESSSSASSVVSSEEGISGGGGSGGHRGSGTRTGQPPVQQSPQSEPSASSASSPSYGDTSSAPSAEGPHVADGQATGTPRRYSAVERPLTAQEQEQNLACGCTCPVCPALRDTLHSASSGRGSQSGLSILLLIIAFGLGYVSKGYRPGSAQVSKKKKTTKKFRSTPLS